MIDPARSVNPATFAASPGATGAIHLLVECMNLVIPAELDARYGFSRLIPECERPVVFIGPYEHHSNELPWRESTATVVVIDEDVDGRIDLDHLDRELVRHAATTGSTAQLKLDDAIADRIKVLAPAARELLECVALAARPMTRAVLVRATSLGGHDTYRFVNILSTGNLVRMTGQRAEGIVEEEIQSSDPETGVAEVVVCYRAFNERSGVRFGGAGRQPGVTPLWMAPYAPFALMTPAGWVALHAQRYMSAYGVTNADFGKISVIDRKHAAKNPDAWFYEKPITLEQHQESRWIIEPVLRLLDCCQESDGGVAMVVTSVERARDLAKPPAIITAAAQGAAYDGEVMTSYYRDEITGLPEMGVVGEKLWRDSGLKPADISTAFLYDHFTPFVFTQLEELGFCGRGEAKDFVSVDELSVGGRMPINTNGGLLGEAYIHGMNGITEGVRQVRGTSYNQVDHVEHVLVTSGTGVPTSGLILTPDR